MKMLYGMDMVLRGTAECCMAFGSAKEKSLEYHVRGKRGQLSTTLNYSKLLGRVAVLSSKIPVAEVPVHWCTVPSVSYLLLTSMTR